MSSTGQFWLGLAFAIPLSIIANLFTPKIQDWLAKRSKTAEQKRALANSKEQARIDELAADLVKLNSFLLLTLIVATMMGASIGVFTALIYMLGTLSKGELGTVLAQGTSVFGGLVVTKICFDAANTAIKVKEARKLAQHGKP